VAEIIQKHGNVAEVRYTRIAVETSPTTKSIFLRKTIWVTRALLGHKRIQNTLKYTQLVNFTGQDEYVCKTAKTTTQAKELIESGFEYVCEMEDAKLFRKRK
jgi:hypothetical protein